ncbi:MAG: hypothetical protein OJI67_07065 [Prosthecobacter sp.]|nr:hypothetical protein [Prosthecobacter sp.]
MANRVALAVGTSALFAPFRSMIALMVLAGVSPEVASLSKVVWKSREVQSRSL